MGVINNGFYYPNETEIHVGWEGEYNASRGYNDIYEPIVISYPKEGETWHTDIEDVLCHAIWDGCDEIRCPLLTKEQIEKEGWNTKYGVEDFARYFEVKGLIYKLSWEYWADGPHIQIWDTNFADCVYKGFCPTINHLRTIMKLLNIK